MDFQKTNYCMNYFHLVWKIVSNAKLSFGNRIRFQDTFSAAEGLVSVREVACASLQCRYRMAQRHPRLHIHLYLQRISKHRLYGLVLATAHPLAERRLLLWWHCLKVSTSTMARASEDRRPTLRCCEFSRLTAFPRLVD